MGSTGTYITGRPNYIDITNMKDWTLEQTERYLRTLDHEEAFAFDTDGKMIAGVRGGATGVGIPSDWINREGITVTHSHPANMVGGYGGTLSLNTSKEGGKNVARGDLPVFAMTKWAELRATAGGRGEMNYILRQNSNSRTQAFVKQMARRANIINRNARNTYSKTYNTLRQQGKTVAQARRVARQKSVGLWDKQYKANASKYGVEYITRKKEYKYNR